ncbi:hypothetical protein [Streptococcus suis]|uniref:hypothetical protein n=1 Tax=Streptococcus suis TaxID=1307 RepID=UPI00209C2AF0|nr:hypothetical protein [Streptococcus suis]MCO8229193.1 hypothetical protein [Streptococcus suis]HEM3442988.1 hypothetical protein [Streptococcus suis]
MNKQKMMSVVTVAGLALSTGVTAFADEGTVKLLSNEEVVVVSEDVVDDGENTVVDETPVETPPSVSEENKGEVPIEKPIVDTGEVKEETPVETPKEEPKEASPTTSEPPKVEPPVIVAPETKPTATEEIPFEPIQKEDGSRIIGTTQGQVVVQETDGTLKTVAPEAVGAQVKSDGNVYIPTKDGKMTRLPETGTQEVASLVASFSGFLLLLSTAYLKIKKGIL